MDTPCCPDPALVAAFARALSASERAWTIDETNRGRPTSLPAALASGSAFAVAPPRRLVVFDCDHPAGEPDHALDALAAAAARCAIPTLQVASGRPGHRHLYLAVGDAHPVDRARLAAWGRARGLDLRDRGVRPPLSPHRLGGTSRLLDPARPQRALDVLGRRPDPGRLTELCDRLSIPDLSWRMRDVAACGHQRGGYPSPSEARAGLATAAAALDLPDGFLAALFTDPAAAVATSFRARPPAWRSAELARLRAKASAWVSAARSAPDLDLWERALRSASWSGSGPATCLALLEGVARLARRSSTLTPAVPLRRCAIEAGVRPETVRRALTRVIDQGWLEVVAEPDATRARRVRLRIPAHLDLSVLTEPPAAVALRDLGEDLARYHGLGKQTARVLRELDATPRPSAALAEVLGSTQRAVQVHCGRLRKLGLADWTAAGWVLGSRDPAEVAEELAVAGSRTRDELDYRRRQSERRAVAVALRRLPSTAR